MDNQAKQSDVFDDLGNKCVYDFPMLIETKDQRRPLYFDNAATTLKPQVVIDAVISYYTDYTSNVFRGQHKFSERASISHQATRTLIASYINANTSEIIFTSNCTNSINLLSAMLRMTKNDLVIVSETDHHSNYLPWLECATIEYIALTDNYIFDVDNFSKTLSKKTKLVALTFVSNVTGNIQPIKEITKICREKGIYTLIDASQAIAHFTIDVVELDCDFLVFSAHKMLGPTGVGVLYGKIDILTKLHPAQFGGGMVNLIQNNKISYKESPYCFEAGTPPIEGIIGYGAAIKYINTIGLDRIESYLQYLGEYARNRFEKLSFIRLAFPIYSKHITNFSFYPVNNKLDVIQISRILSDSYNIIVSAGLHCCQPLYNKANLSGAIRASFYIYNTTEDIDNLVSALEDIKCLF